MVGHDLHVPGRVASDLAPAPSAVAREPVRRTPEPTPPRRPSPARVAPAAGPAARPAGGAPRPRTPTPRPRTPSARPRRGTGPLPAMARFFGRRNTVGDIVPLTETEIPLPPTGPGRWLRPALTIAIAAGCSFVVVALIMWLLGPASR